MLRCISKRASSSARCRQRLRLARLRTSSVHLIHLSSHPQHPDRAPTSRSLSQSPCTLHRDRRPTPCRARFLATAPYLLRGRAPTARLCRRPPTATMKPVVSAFNAWTWYERAYRNTVGRDSELRESTQHRHLRLCHRHPKRNRRHVRQQPSQHGRIGRRPRRWGQGCRCSIRCCGCVRGKSKRLGVIKMIGRWDANNNHGSGFPSILRLPSDHAQETEWPWRNSIALIRRSRRTQIV